MLSLSSFRVRYTNRWAMEVRGGDHVAQAVARDHGFHYFGHVRIVPALPVSPIEPDRDAERALPFSHRGSTPS